MQNYRLISETVERKHLESITCDKCKTTYTDELELQEFLVIDIVGGYNSVFGDMSRISADICQHCLKVFLNGVYKIEYYMPE